MNILISRTDAIGDVILTIPMAGYLKKEFPGCKIFFLGRTYTKPIVEISEYIDDFLNWDSISKLPEAEQVNTFSALNLDWFIHVYPDKKIAQIAHKAKVKNRVGTSHRTYNWLTCNKKVSFSRKKSDLHEAQLNFKLLEPLGIEFVPELKVFPFLYGMKAKVQELPVSPSKNKVSVILHPKSKGSAREWGLDNFERLIDLLQEDTYEVFISGTEADKNEMADWLKKIGNKAVDITGKLNLEQFVSFIGQADALIAASTGPLHIASALGKKAIGIYPPIRPMHPGRWKPLGQHAEVLVKEIECESCRKLNECACMLSISPEDVVRLLES